MKRLAPTFRRSAFILFETMLAVTIFSLAVLSLGKCVDNCLRAEMLKEEDGRARRYLENRMAEIESGAVSIEKDQTAELKEMFAGMTLHQSRQVLKRQNEKKQDIVGIYAVKLDLDWKSRGEKQTRTLLFYVYPKPGQT